jgi:hypothetical protein
MRFVTAFKIDAVLLLGFLVLCIWEEVRDRRKAREFDAQTKWAACESAKLAERARLAELKCNVEATVTETLQRRLV